ncbi:AraC family transcriptional regulator [Paenibacillus sepulcri]|uniref:AraC family transcriptional regulator n=1 Tax=Paenibacillus sepulcri TaxID=359917 RepID=A0ABS7BY32_9BACL|nr:AraC family transcriptional regulator [Paenibacillus sepulcri]
MSRGNYFRKSLIYALIMTSVPMAIIGICSYFIGVNQVEKEVYQKNHYQLDQVFKRFDELFSQFELTVDKGAANSIFDEKLRNTNFIDEFRVMQDIYSLLAVTQSSDDMILRIDLYLENQQLLVSNDRGAIKLKDEPNKAVYDMILKSEDLMYWSDTETYSPNGGELFPLVLVHKLPFVSTRPYGALLVYLDKSLLDKEITQMNPYENGISFIIKPNGDWITSGKETETDPDKQDLKDYIRGKVIKEDRNADSFTVKWEGAEYSVANATLSRTGWRYVIATPLSQLMEPITLTSKFMLGASLLGVVIAALLSWFASQRMYRPIKRLVQMFGGSIGSKLQEEDRSDEIKYIENKWLHITRESRLFQSLLEENRYSMKKGFLLQLIQGQLYFFSENELRRRMEEHGWNTENKRFALLLIQLSPFSELSKRFVEGDEQLVTFAAANIMEELSGDKENMEAVNLHNLTVAQLIWFGEDKPKEQIKSELFRFSNEVITIITKLLGVHVAVGVSRTIHELKDLPTALEEVKQCLHFRNIGEHGQILSTDDLIPYVKDNPDYPFQIEKEFIHALQMRAGEETLQKWNEFILVLRQNAGKAFQIQQYMAQLLGSVLRAMMQLGVVYSSASQGINLYEQLFRLKEIDEINKWFVNKVIHPFLIALSEKQGIEMKQTIRKAKDIIDQEYMKDISLEYLSDRIGILPKRLSAIFVQVTNQNFIDYVTGIRLDKTKQLLRNTDLKVTEIAARVGYQPSYLNKIFKKSEGITPGEYRESVLRL